MPEAIRYRVGFWIGANPHIWLDFNTNYHNPEAAARVAIRRKYGADWDEGIVVVAQHEAVDRGLTLD